MTKLQIAVVDQLGGTESLPDIAKYGASGGYGGFIYYSDTVKFYDDNKELIWDHLYEVAEGQGVNVLELIASFGGAKDVGSDDQFKNLLAWFALEEVAHELTN